MPSTIITLCHDCYYVWGEWQLLRTRVPTIAARTLWQISRQIEHFDCLVQSCILSVFYFSHATNSEFIPTLPPHFLSVHSPSKGQLLLLPVVFLHLRLWCINTSICYAAMLLTSPGELRHSTVADLYFIMEIVPSIIDTNPQEMAQYCLPDLHSVLPWDDL